MREAALKKAILYLSIPLALFMLTLSLALVFGPGRVTADTPSPPVYTLKDDGGYPALFQSGKSLPLRTYPSIYTHLLPSQDAEALQNGIAVEDEEELRRLIEDFGG
ncbi:MAG: BofC C-terminal domain-containing protein [Oscillospiraceae bacterium]|nr:BofC C-terminal domain-containing protein [Oscillospiraceae bacterium]